LSTNEPSRFSRDFKLEALRRMQAGENVSVLARDLGVSRKSIYKWRDRYRLCGSNALRGRGRMTKAERAAHEETLIAKKRAAKEARQASLEELARAQRRIAALERKIDQQQVERRDHRDAYVLADSRRTDMPLFRKIMTQRRRPAAHIRVVVEQLRLVNRIIQARMGWPCQGGDILTTVHSPA
jgi:transposase